MTARPPIKPMMAASLVTGVVFIAEELVLAAIAAQDGPDVDHWQQRGIALIDQLEALLGYDETTPDEARALLATRARTAEVVPLRVVPPAPAPTGPEAA